MILRNKEYDRAKAVEYAHRWAYFRNPAFYDFSAIGGDCTNYASQCIFAGSGVMNFTPTFGWYYIDINDRAPAWTGVKYLYNFLINNTGAGPYGREVPISEVRPGDICQLIIDEEDWQHSPVVVAVGRNARTYANIWVAAHSYDCDCRPLSSYAIRQARFIHIDGVREIVGNSLRNGNGMGNIPPIGTVTPPTPPTGTVTSPTSPTGTVTLPAPPTGAVLPQTPPTGTVTPPTPPTGTVTPPTPPTGTVTPPTPTTGTVTPPTPPTGTVTPRIPTIGTVMPR